MDVNIHAEGAIAVVGSRGQPDPEACTHGECVIVRAFVRENFLKNPLVTAQRPR